VALKGGAIASSNAANSDLTAQSISFENIANKMDYAASSDTTTGACNSAGNCPEIKWHYFSKRDSI